MIDFKDVTMETKLRNTKLFPMVVIYIYFTFIYLPEKFVMTSQQFKKELQESGGVNQIFIPQKNESFAEGLKQTGNRLRNAIFIILIFCFV